jgi:hypothetical protein
METVVISSVVILGASALGLAALFAKNAVQEHFRKAEQRAYEKQYEHLDVEQGWLQ